MLGTDFPYRPFYPEDGPVVQVDVRGEHIGRRVPVDVRARRHRQGHASTRCCRDSSRRPDTASSRPHARRTTAEPAAGWTRSPTRARQASPLHPQFVAATLDRARRRRRGLHRRRRDAVLWAARYLTMNGRRRLIGSFNHGTMANALPQAIGAQAGAPGPPGHRPVGRRRPGDAARRAAHAAPATAPVKVVVFNNGALSFVELEMKARRHRHLRHRPRQPGLRRHRPGHRPARRPGRDHRQTRAGPPGRLRPRRPGPDRRHHGPQELSLPPTITFEQAKGFTLWATRTILSGDGGELVESPRPTSASSHSSSGYRS